MEGLTWGKGELIPGPFGLQLVGIACVIIDDLCSSDELCDKVVEAYEDGVQSC